RPAELLHRPGEVDQGPPRRVEAELRRLQGSAAFRAQSPSGLTRLQGQSPAGWSSASSPAEPAPAPAPLVSTMVPLLSPTAPWTSRTVASATPLDSSTGSGQTGGGGATA